jgi:hypothetical protein
LVILCFSAFRFRTRRDIKLGILVLILAGVLLLLGNKSYAGQLIEHIPLLNQIRHPPRHMPMLLILIILLAALGLDDMLRVAKGAMLAPLVSTNILIIVGAILGSAVILAKNELRYDFAGLAGIIFVAASALCSLALLYPRRSIVYAAVLGMTAWLGYDRHDPRIYPRNSNPTPHLNEILSALSESAAVKHVRQGRLVFFGSEFNGAQSLPTFAASAGASVLLSAAAPSPYEQFWRVTNFGAGIGNKDLVLGARFLLSSGPLPPAGWEPIDRLGDLFLYQNAAAYPLAYGANTVSGLLDPADNGLPALATTPILGEPKIFLDRDAAPHALKAVRENEEGHPQITAPQWHGANISFLVDGDSSAIVALNYFGGPAWRAWVNGQERNIIRVNGLHPGVLVEPGHNTIVFRYGSRLLDTLWLLSLASLLLFAVFFCYSLIKRSRQR